MQPEAGATGLEPATSGVTGATERTANVARLSYLKRSRSRRSISTSADAIGAV
jgi:hypothetical protein